MCPAASNGSSNRQSAASQPTSSTRGAVRGSMISQKQKTTRRECTAPAGWRCLRLMCHWLGGLAAAPCGEAGSTKHEEAHGARLGYGPGEDASAGALQPEVNDGTGCTGSGAGKARPAEKAPVGFEPD